MREPTSSQFPSFGVIFIINNNREYEDLFVKWQVKKKENPKIPQSSSNNRSLRTLNWSLSLLYSRFLSFLCSETNRRSGEDRSAMKVSVRIIGLSWFSVRNLNIDRNWRSELNRSELKIDNLHRLVAPSSVYLSKFCLVVYVIFGVVYVD